MARAMPGCRAARRSILLSPWTTPRPRSSRLSWPRRGARCARPGGGTRSGVGGVKETIAADGLVSALYPDRGSHYFHTPKAGEPVDKTHLTQVGRALKQLGIEHIPSYCPEGRGRMERLFGTLQSRLPPLMRLEGIASIEAANRWLATVYIPHHNARFAGAAAEEGTAFVPFVGVLDDILCVQEERVVRNDNTVRYEGPCPRS